MAEIRIIQGNQIGGCVTVISAETDGQTHRIMIDYGSSLPGSEITEDFQYPWDSEPVDAVFFTHYHGDHVRRFMDIPATIPLYMGEVARKVMINIQEALSGIRDKKEAEIHKKELAVLRNDTRVHSFHWNGKTYDPITDIPGFRIEPYSVDHSAYDAYMFLIEAADETMPGGKKIILHTGDFRGHGRRGKAMIPIIKYYVHKNGRHVNSLITEGTMMSRMDEKVRTEDQMMREAVDYLRDHRYAFLICSSTNLDSLASFYQAAQIANMPYSRYLYTYNDYYKVQLDTFSKTAGGFTDVYNFSHVFKLDLKKDLKSDNWIESMTQKKFMEKTGFIAVIKPEDWCAEKYVKPFVEDYKAGKIDQMPVIIYSMWDGYLKEYVTGPNGEKRENPAKKPKWIEFIKEMEAEGVEIKHLHTSGHASPQMLADVINEVAPTDEILPMHTEHPELFTELPIIEELKKKIRFDSPRK